MIIEIEETFIKNFVYKNKVERSIYELRSSKKRGSFFGKLCHRNDEIFDSKYLNKIDAPNSNSEYIYQLLLKHGAVQSCYLMSSFEEIDQKSLPLREALEVCVGRGLPSIVICIPSKLAYFESEQDVGPPQRILLIRN